MPHMKRLIIPISLLIICISFSLSISAQTKVRVKFAKGASSIALKGKVIGYKYIDYLVRAKSGQTMSVSLDSTNAGCSFVIFYSDMNNVDEATDVTNFTRNVDVDDDYIIRVLLPRSAARRKESAAYTLNIGIE